MRLSVIAATVLGVAAAAAAAAFASGIVFRATLLAGTHRPAINTRWPYAVKVVDSKGRPLRARISVAVVDPIGGVHPTQFYVSTRYVTNIPFRGTFRDAVLWPPESRGYQLTFRVTLLVGKTRRVLKYLVVPG